MLQTWATAILLLSGIYERQANALSVPYVPPPSAVLEAEGVTTIKPLLAATPPGGAINPTGWTVACDSFQPGNECNLALDGDSTTFWHTEWNPINVPLPHMITIDMQAIYLINGLTYLPRQDGNSNGNIGQHKIFLSTDGTNFGSPVAFGTWLDDSTMKTAAFETQPARYVRIQAITEAGGRGPWTSAAEINIYGTPSGHAINRTAWTAACDSFQPGNECNLALDNNPATFWHTEWNPINVPLPHMITIDMQTSYIVNGLTYLPRQDGNSNGNIGQYNIFLSTDGTNFGSPVVSGTWPDDSTMKTAVFGAQPARYVRMQAITEAGGRGPWTSAAEINIYAAASYTPPPNGLGKWGPTINFPIVPVAGAVEPTTGKVLTWSSYSPSTFVGGNGGQTVTATYDPNSLTVTQRTVTETGHDMFCPGISFDFNGRLIVTGGNNAPKTSIYDPGSDGWTSAADMQIPRGYQASATCSDGRIFTIGGSWSGGLGGKNGEIYNPATNTWTLLPGCPVGPMLTADSQGIYRADNHGWLFGWKNKYVFQAGPSKAMNWYNTASSGAQSAAGNRAADGDSMAGNGVMYDAVNGKILTLGGSPDYQGSPSTGAAHIITIATPNTMPQVTQITSMSYNRIFANAVVLPNGQVFVTGGQTIGMPFSDDNADLTPEMWDPATNRFTKMLPNSIPRTYHSIALLLPDGTVLSGGGGLCDSCSTNHFDTQIYTPQYLLNADGTSAKRPVINSVSATSIKIGRTLTIRTDSAITSMSLIRYGSATHTVDTDQRRIPLTLTSAGTNTYSVVVPSDAGIALPGYWMLFTMNSAGVPSVAKTIKVTL
jgi:galactose oxidase